MGGNASPKTQHEEATVGALVPVVVRIQVPYRTV